MTDPPLEARLAIYRKQPDVHGESVDLVAAVLKKLETDYIVTDSNAGVFVSHLVMAINRILNGEEIESPPQEVYQQLLTEDPGAESVALDIAEYLEQKLPHSLPKAELEFLVIHLAVIRNQQQEQE